MTIRFAQRAIGPVLWPARRFRAHDGTRSDLQSTRDGNEGGGGGGGGGAAAPILMYHRVLPDGASADWPLKSLVVDARSFEFQMHWLVQEFEVCTVSELLFPTSRSARPRAAVTFDDGYADNFTHAAPVLEGLGARGTFFATTAFIGSRKRLWFDVAAKLAHRRVEDGSGEPVHDFMSRVKALAPPERTSLLESQTTPEDWASDERDRAMTVSELKSLAGRGHEIGIHTRTHPILTGIPHEELRDEVSGSLADVKAWGLSAIGIAYPNGNASADVVHECRQAGLRYGLTTRLGWRQPASDPFLIPRADANPRRWQRWSSDPAAGLRSELAWLSLRYR